MEHRWTFELPASVYFEVHIEAQWASADGDASRFDYSTNGFDFHRVSGPFTSLSDTDNDLVLPVAAAATGTVTLRVIDAEGGTALDTLVVDHLWIRAVP